ncbi:hypothetical protein Vadar_031281 [Vaccinium darrowii]|uniref:Uncharacterized protein n=1 Tax=Vaccinium darrowii TaxID=229202 RepID=A0ACB7YR34_9ERIC|nr:hypothetical protein Vadar_031281 [Vaccinium darrowii]
MPKVANNGEIGRLKFTCRYPNKNWRSDIKYVPLPINDDETLSNVLCMSSTFPSCLEIYVELEYTYAQEQMTLLGSSTFAKMLSQETLPRSGQLSMPFIDYSSQNQVVLPRHSHDNGGCSTATLGCDVLHTSNNACNAEGPSLGGEFGCTEEYGDDVEIGNRWPDENSDEDVDALFASNEDNFDDNEDVGEEVPTKFGCIEVGDDLNPAIRIPYYSNINLGNDGSVVDWDIVNRGPLWDASTMKLEQGMVFKDKIQLQHAVIAYHVKMNRQYTVVDSRKNL